MNRAIIKKYTDSEIIKELTKGRFRIEDYYIQETNSGDYIYSASSDGEHFNFYGEDVAFHRAVLNFLRNREVKIVSWEDYVNSLRKPGK